MLAEAGKGEEEGGGWEGDNIDKIAANNGIAKSKIGKELDWKIYQQITGVRSPILWRGIRAADGKG